MTADLSAIIQDIDSTRDCGLIKIGWRWVLPEYAEILKQEINQPRVAADEDFV